MPLEFGGVEDPITAAERTELAQRTCGAMSLSMPALVDGMDDAVNHAWQAGPERLYLVGKDGRVAYAGGPGPFEYRPDELEAAIRKELGLADRE